VIFRYTVVPRTSHLTDANRMQREIADEIRAAESAAAKAARVYHCLRCGKDVEVTAVTCGDCVEDQRALDSSEGGGQ
jgi:hypothetical protein